MIAVFVLAGLAALVVFWMLVGAVSDREPRRHRPSVWARVARLVRPRRGIKPTHRSGS